MDAYSSLLQIGFTNIPLAPPLAKSLLFILASMLCNTSVSFGAHRLNAYQLAN